MTEPDHIKALSGHEMDLRTPDEDDIDRVSVDVKGFQCGNCGHEWTPRSSDPPKVCPECKSYEWDQEDGGEISFEGYECQRCGNDWVPRSDDTPLVCHECKRYDWWTEERDAELHQAYRERSSE